MLLGIIVAINVIIWFIYWIVVLTFPPLTLFLAFVMWLLLWPAVLIIPPASYIAGWLFICLLIVLTVLLFIISLIVCVGSLILPIGCCTLVLISGPVLALKVPYFILVSFYYNPIDMWANIKRSVLQYKKIIRIVEKCLNEFSNDNDNDNGNHEVDNQDIRKFDYWSLFIARCTDKSREIQLMKWIHPDDVMGMSSTATLAIPLFGI